jgi:hypothetical protein
MSGTFRDIGSLKRWRQPRTPESEKAQVEFLTACFKHLGEKQLVPIIIMSDGRIVDGHCRWLALKAAGRNKAWVVVWPDNRPDPTTRDIEQINLTQKHVEPSSKYFTRIHTLYTEHGWSVRKIARALDKDEANVGKELRAWDKLSETEKEKVRKENPSRKAVVNGARAVAGQKLDRQSKEPPRILTRYLDGCNIKHVANEAIHTITIKLAKDAKYNSGRILVDISEFIRDNNEDAV